MQLHGFYVALGKCEAFTKDQRGCYVVHTRTCMHSQDQLLPTAPAQQF